MSVCHHTDISLVCKFYFIFISQTITDQGSISKVMSFENDIVLPTALIFSGSSIEALSVSPAFIVKILTSALSVTE